MILRLALAATALLIPSLAHAQQGTPSPGPAGRLQMMDLNHDGAITGAEVSSMQANRFEQMDGNRDGFISTEEMGPRQQALRLDTDADGRVSRTEFTANAPRVIDRWDRNRDGQLSSDEIANAESMMANRRGMGAPGEITGRDVMTVPDTGTR